MVRFNKTVIGLVSFMTLIMSIRTLVHTYQSSPSSISDVPTRLMQGPLLAFNLLIMVHSLLGLAGACSRISFFVWAYFFVTFLLILAVAGIIIFGFVVTNKALGDGGWLQDRVENKDTWKELSTNLKKTDICAMSGGKDAKDVMFFENFNAPLKTGCCNPPTSCGLTYVNATYWTIPKSGPSSPEKDCKTWTNDQSMLCFDCDSCKAGMLHYIRHGWKVASIIFGCVLGFLVIVCSFGCCASKNDKDANYQHYKGAYP